MAEARRSTELATVADQLREIGSAEPGSGAARDAIEQAMLEGAVERRGDAMGPSVQSQSQSQSQRPGAGTGASMSPSSGGRVGAAIPLFQVQIGQGMAFLRGLGRAQARVLLWLVEVVRTVCSRSSENRMSVRAMGIVMGPNLVTPPVVLSGGSGSGGIRAGLDTDAPVGSPEMVRIDGEEDEDWEDDEPDPAEALASARRCARLLELIAAC